MKSLLILNRPDPDSEINPDISFQIIKGPDAYVGNMGPEGAFMDFPDKSTLYLKPPNAIAPALVNQTELIDLEGTFAIEVDGQVIPYSFTPNTMVEFFAQESSYGLEVVKYWTVQYTKISTGEIVQVDAGIDLDPESIDPGYNWMGGELGGEELTVYENDLLDRKDLIVAPGVVSIAPNTFAGWLNVTNVNLQGGGTIGPSAFIYLPLSNVNIGPGVTTIEQDAFGYNGTDAIASVTFEEGVSRIEDNAFNGWSTGIEILLPQSIRYLGNYSFGNWTQCSSINLGGLIEIGTMEGGVTPFDGTGKNVDVPLDLDMGTSLTTIGNGALGYMTAGNKLTFSPVLEHIGTYGLADWGYALGSISSTLIEGKTTGIFDNGTQSTYDIILPASVTQIDDFACMRMRTQAINIAGNDQLVFGEFAFELATAESLVIGQANLTKDYSFQQMYKLVNLDLGLGITNLTGNYTFQSAHSLETVTIPGGCKVVAGGIFNACSNLSNVVMEEGIEQIGLVTNTTGLFNGSVGDITEIVYPNSVVNFYGDQLSSLSKLESVYFGDNLATFTAPDFSSSVRNIYMMSTFKEGFVAPSLAAPWVTLYLNDLPSWIGGTDPNTAKAFAYVDKPVTAMIPTLTPLEALANESAWSIQYRNLTTGLVEQIDVTDTISLGSLGSVTLIDEVVINSSVVAILPEALAFESIKRFKALPGLVYAGGPIGIQRLKEATLPDTVKRIGSPIFIDTSLETVTMPLTGYDSINVDQFATWPEGIGHPTVSVSPATPTAVTTTATEISGSVTGLETIVKALNGVGELYGEDIAGVDGSFTITLADKTLANNDVITFNVTDIVGNISTTTFLANIVALEPLADEMYFTTTAGQISYQGVAGDIITLSDDSTYNVINGDAVDYTVPAGKHKVKLVAERSSGYVGIGGETLTELNSFPSLESIQAFNFAPNTPSTNLVKVPTVLPSNIIDLTYMFGGCSIFNQDISMWDVSHVTNMQSMFYGTTLFNQDISGWNTSNVTTMSNMFNYSTSFNQPIGSWNVSKVTNMSFMFISLAAFNQDISGWDVSNVTNMEGMFAGSTAFNSPLDTWNTSKVTNMVNMFYGSTLFNQDLSQWCVGLIGSEPALFKSESSLSVANTPVWGTCPRGEDIGPDEMYFSTVAGTLYYKGVEGDTITLSNGTIYTVLDLAEKSYTVPAGKHKVKLSSVRSYSTVHLAGEPLTEVHNFPTIASINRVRFHIIGSSPNLVKVPTVLPSNLTDASFMFYGCSNFNQNISMWDTSNVTSMSQMFYGAMSFNRDLSQWCVPNILSTPDGFAYDTPNFIKPVWGTCPRGENLV